MSNSKYDYIIPSGVPRDWCQIPNMTIEYLQGYQEIDVKFQIWQSVSLFSIHFFLPCLLAYCLTNQMPALNMLLGPFSSQAVLLFWFYPRQSQWDGVTSLKKWNWIWFVCLNKAAEAAYLVLASDWPGGCRGGREGWSGCKKTLRWQYNIYSGT